MAESLSPVLAELSKIESRKRPFTGCLEITHRGSSQHASVYVFENRIYAVHLDQFMPKVAERLAAAGLLDTHRQGIILDRFGTMLDVRVGPFAVEQGWVDKAVLGAVHKEYILAALGAISTWKRPTIKRKRRAITNHYCSVPADIADMIDAVARREDYTTRTWERLCSTVPFEDAVPHIVTPVGSGAHLPPEALSLSHVCDSDRTLDEVAGEIGVTRFEAITLFDILVREGNALIKASRKPRPQFTELPTPETAGRPSPLITPDEDAPLTDGTDDDDSLIISDAETDDGDDPTGWTDTSAQPEWADPQSQADLGDVTDGIDAPDPLNYSLYGSGPEVPDGTVIPDEDPYPTRTLADMAAELLTPPPAATGKLTIDDVLATPPLGSLNGVDLTELAEAHAEVLTEWTLTDMRHRRDEATATIDHLLTVAEHDARATRSEVDAAVAAAERARAAAAAAAAAAEAAADTAAAATTRHEQLAHAMETSEEAAATATAATHAAADNYAARASAEAAAAERVEELQRQLAIAQAELQERQDERAEAEQLRDDARQAAAAAERDADAARTALAEHQAGVLAPAIEAQAVTRQEQQRLAEAAVAAETAATDEPARHADLVLMLRGATVELVRAALPEEPPAEDDPTDTLAGDDEGDLLAGMSREQVEGGQHALPAPPLDEDPEATDPAIPVVFTGDDATRVTTWTHQVRELIQVIDPFTDPATGDITWPDLNDTHGVEGAADLVRALARIRILVYTNDGNTMDVLRPPRHSLQWQDIARVTDATYVEFGAGAAFGQWAKIQDENSLRRLAVELGILNVDEVTRPHLVRYIHAHFNPRTSPAEVQASIDEQAARRRHSRHIGKQPMELATDHGHE